MYILNRQKLKGFTLNEMLVVIIITVIVVGMAFSVLSMVQKHMASIKENFHKKLEVDKLNEVLNIDFNRYATINYNDLDDELIFTSETNSTKYKFSNEYVTKDRDTFFIPIKKKRLYFNGSQLANDKVDAIKLTTTKAYLSQNIFVYKRNDALSFLE